MDLSDPDERTRCAARLGEVFRDRRVVHGPRVLAAVVHEVAMVAGHGASGSLVVASVRGAGEIPPEDAAEVVWLPHREFASVTEELRCEDARVRQLPDDAVAVLDAFDPDRTALWMGTPFVSSDEPVLGRRVMVGRPAAWLALEDKVVAEDVWAAAGITHAPSAVVAVTDAASLESTSQELDRGDGVVWTGDNRDGFNGGGNFVRWVTGAPERAAASEFFASRCDQVRVLPFLDGVPCSIHGFVTGRGTAALRPVEIAMLRRTAEDRHEFVYGGLSTYWDPPEADRAEMRAAARRVGEHLRDRVAYRGFFGIDGVLTADGFRPTELNTRLSAGVVTQLARIEPQGLATLMQVHATSYAGPGDEDWLGAEEVESLVPALDAQRTGRVSGLWEGPVDAGRLPAGEASHPVHYDGESFHEAEEGDTFAVALNATGLFAHIRSCTALEPGQRVAPLNRALMQWLDAHYGTGFGDVVPAPDVR